MTGRPKIVVLGMMSKIPVGGVIWQTVHYLLGFRRLGFDAYYVEAHARTPAELMTSESDDSGALASGFIDGVMRRFDLQDRWAYHALHSDGRCFGMSEQELRRLYRSAELIVNLHGGTSPRPEHSETGRLVYIETDPVQLQVELQLGLAETVEFLEHHCAFFTFGENWGAPDCALPKTDLFDFKPTRQPVYMDHWHRRDDTPRPQFTTVGNWRQQWRDVTLDGNVYTWTKDVEFEKFIDLPTRTGRGFELALSGYSASDRSQLEANDWQVIEALPFSRDPDAYRDYISTSFGEFTVAKDQNVRLRSGWFSDRSATYLAAGRPVVTQETGFSNVLPTGGGLHAFTTLEEAVSGIESVCSAYDQARASAREIAFEYFDSDIVLGALLTEVGVTNAAGERRPKALVEALPLQPASRRPLRLVAGVDERIRGAPLPPVEEQKETPQGSVVVVSHDNLALTRLCLESILENTTGPPYELVVIDNASRDASRPYLLTLSRRFSHVRLVLEPENLGFPRACNEGLAHARGDLLVLLNNDTVVPPGWLERLEAHTKDPDVGLVGAVTNRIGNEAEVEASYVTYGDFLRAAEDRAAKHAGKSFDIPMPAMFCLAFRRDVYERLGPLDEQFGIGTLEDDDYALRSIAAGYRNVCADDVFVHHFGEGSFGDLYASGAHTELIGGNRRRFEQKWGAAWKPYNRRQSEEYRSLTESVRRVVVTRLPGDASVIVVTRGDDELLELDGRRGLHFPQAENGGYAGHYPADSADAIAHLELLRRRGGSHFVLPSTGFWWLDFYDGLRAHLETRYAQVHRDDACIVYSLEEAKT